MFAQHLKRSAARGRLIATLSLALLVSSCASAPKHQPASYARPTTVDEHLAWAQQKASHGDQSNSASAAFQVTLLLRNSCAAGPDTACLASRKWLESSPPEHVVSPAQIRWTLEAPCLRNVDSCFRLAAYDCAHFGNEASDPTRERQDAKGGRTPQNEEQESSAREPKSQRPNKLILGSIGGQWNTALDSLPAQGESWTNSGRLVALAEGTHWRVWKR